MEVHNEKRLREIENSIDILFPKARAQAIEQWMAISQTLADAANREEALDALRKPPFEFSRAQAEFVLHTRLEHLVRETGSKQPD